VNSYSVIEISNTDWVPLTFQLRYAVWKVETALLPHIVKQGLITDEHDAHARHWAAFVGDKIVAAARMCIHEVQEESPDAPAFSRIQLPTPVATINRLIVVQSARKSGLAKQLDERRIFAAMSDGAKCIVGTAAPGRIAALGRLGFRITGEKWTQPYCESLRMQGMVLTL
jgi:predicted GNAT family N-acyltransferase